MSATQDSNQRSFALLQPAEARAFAVLQLHAVSDSTVSGVVRRIPRADLLEGR